MYAYAGDDPVDFNDPTGLDFFPIGGSYGIFDGIFGSIPALLLGQAGACCGSFGFGPGTPYSPGPEDGIGVQYQGLGGYFGIGTGVISASATVRMPPGVDPEDFGNSLMWDLVPFGMAEGEASKLAGRAARNEEQRVVRELLRKLGIDPKYYERYHNEINRLVKEEGKQTYEQLLEYITDLTELFGK